nr:helix-turn-helix domain-containing protein [Chitinophaga filiformis]
MAGLQLVRPSRRADLYQSFLELLSTGIPVRNTVNYYAELLNTTAQHLNIACRNATGTGATEVLAGFIIKEARRLLLYTDKTVSEISFLLNFNDPSHFVKYFKRLSGSTPQAFRSMK